MLKPKMRFPSTLGTSAGTALREPLALAVCRPRLARDRVGYWAA